MLDTVSSIDVNYTGESGMQLRIPSKAGALVLETMDIPGHYNFRGKIQEICDGEPAGIIMLIDAKDK